MRIIKSDWKELEENNYSKKSRNQLVENDEMDPWESAWMDGYDQAG
jgi:hypothetical protein